MEKTQKMLKHVLPLFLALHKLDGSLLAICNNCCCAIPIVSRQDFPESDCLRAGQHEKSAALTVVRHVRFALGVHCRLGTSVTFSATQ
jgi:hypothetical protein